MEHSFSEQMADKAARAILGDRITDSDPLGVNHAIIADLTARLCGTKVAGLTRPVMTVGHLKNMPFTVKFRSACQATGGTPLANIYNNRTLYEHKELVAIAQIAAQLQGLIPANFSQRYQEEALSSIVSILEDVIDFGHRRTHFKNPDDYDWPNKTAAIADLRRLKAAWKDVLAVKVGDEDDRVRVTMHIVGFRP